MAPVPAEKTGTRLQAFKAELETERVRRGFADLLPAHVPVQRFTRNLVIACVENPKLLQANRATLYKAAQQAATLGLVTDGLMGEAYLVPFWDRDASEHLVQMIPGYRGMLKLVRQSGEISSVDVDIIGTNDEVDYVLGDDARLEVRPNWEDRGEVRGAFCVVRLRDGGLQRVVMTRAQIEKIRAGSHGYRAAVATAKKFKREVRHWSIDHFEEYAKIRALRRACKLLPVSTEAQQAGRMLDAEDQGEAGWAVPDDAGPPARHGAAAHRPGRRLDALEDRTVEDSSDADAVSADPLGDDPSDDAGPSDPPSENTDEAFEEPPM